MPRGLFQGCSDRILQIRVIKVQCRSPMSITHIMTSTPLPNLFHIGSYLMILPYPWPQSCDSLIKKVLWLLVPCPIPCILTSGVQECPHQWLFCTYGKSLYVKQPSRRSLWFLAREARSLSFLCCLPSYSPGLPQCPGPSSSPTEIGASWEPKPLEVVFSLKHSFFHNCMGALSFLNPYKLALCFPYYILLLYFIIYIYLYTSQLEFQFIANELYIFTFQIPYSALTVAGPQIYALLNVFIPYHKIYNWTNEIICAKACEYTSK